MSRKKVAINPEWQQNGFTAIPNFILEAAPRVTGIPTVNALAYLQFIANRYDSSHREHTIPTSDVDFADYSGFSPKTAQKIRLALLKAGLILSERAKQACWFITFCDRATAVNISPERHNIPYRKSNEGCFMASPRSHPLALPNEVKRLQLGSIIYYQNELYLNNAIHMLSCQSKNYPKHIKLSWYSDLQSASSFTLADSGTLWKDANLFISHLLLS